MSAPGSVDFGTESSQQSVILRNTGGTAATFATDDDGGAAITQSPASGTIPAGGQTSVTVTINRGSLPEGPLNRYSVVFNTSAGGHTTTLNGTVRRAPFVSNVSQPQARPDPARNRCNSSWVVTAGVSDDSTLQTVELLYILGSQAEQRAVMTGPADRRSGTYTSPEIPASADNPLTYRVRAVDEFGAETIVNGPAVPNC